MTGFLLISIIAIAVSQNGRGEGLRPKLSHGTISYTSENGRRETIALEKQCSDLWVSPDEQVMAFITVDKAEPPNALEREPFIEASSIYIAEKSDHFKPVRIGFESVSINNQVWGIFRRPSVSPDLRTIYFQVPYTMTAWRLMSYSLTTHSFATIRDVTAYCVIWGGSSSGDLLLSTRQDPPPSAPQGILYPCYLTTSSSGYSTMIADGKTRDCWAFERFATTWAREHGGYCRQGLIDN